jgi:hypothetical protein
MAAMRMPEQARFWKRECRAGLALGRRHGARLSLLRFACCKLDSLHADRLANLYLTNWRDA